MTDYVALQPLVRKVLRAIYYSKRTFQAGVS